MVAASDSGASSGYSSVASHRHHLLDDSILMDDTQPGSLTQIDRTYRKPSITHTAAAEGGDVTMEAIADHTDYPLCASASSSALPAYRCTVTKPHLTADTAALPPVPCSYHLDPNTDEHELEGAFAQFPSTILVNRIAESTSSVFGLGNLTGSALDCGKMSLLVSNETSALGVCYFFKIL